MEGFFDGADTVTEAMASTSAAVQGVPVETFIPSVKLDPIEENA